MSDLVGVEDWTLYSTPVFVAEFDAYQDSNPGHPKHLPFRTAADPSRTTTRENTGDKNAGRSPMGRVGIPKT